LERLPALNYSLLKDQNMRKKMWELGISSNGSRQLLEKRHKEWITLWNANCDATKPKSKSDLKRELETWERTQGGKVTASTSTQMGAKIRDKDFDGKAWSNQHNDDFQQLIAKARRKPEAKPQDPVSVPTPSESAGTPAPEVANSPDVVMSGTGGDEPIVIEDSPARPASQRRFFDESNSEPPRSSQYQKNLGVLNKDAGLASDITIGPLQP